MKRCDAVTLSPHPELSNISVSFQTLVSWEEFHPLFLHPEKSKISGRQCKRYKYQLDES